MTEFETTPASGGLEALDAYLASIAPEYTPVERLSQWLQGRQAALVPLPPKHDETPGHAKEPFVDPSLPSVVIKRYRSGNFAADDGYLGDETAFALADDRLPGFVVATAFATVRDGLETTDYQLQNMLYGERFKAVTDDEAMNANQALRKIDPAAADAIGSDQAQWRRLQKEGMRRRLGDERLRRTRESVGQLISPLLELEDGSYRVRDLDFFIDGAGKITIFDLDILDAGHPKMRADPETHGWRYWQLLAQLFEL